MIPFLVLAMAAATASPGAAPGAADSAAGPAAVLSGESGRSVLSGVSGKSALTLSAAVERALIAHPGIAVLQAGVEAAEGLRSQASAWPNPEVEAAPGLKQARGEGTGFHGELSLSQTLEFPGKRALRKSLAQGDVRLRSLAVEGFRRQLRIEVQRAFFAALEAGRIAALREEQVQSAETFLKSARKRVEAGYASDFEAIQAQADWIAARKALAGARSAVSAAKLSLAGWMGAPSDTAFTVAGTLDATSLPARGGDPVAQALAGNYALRAQALEADLARTRVAAARLEAKPDLTFGPSVEYSREERIYGLNLSLPLPLWNRGRGQVGAAEAEARGAAAEGERMRQEIRAAVLAAQEKVRLAAEQLALYTPAFLADLKNILERAEKVYGQSATTLLIYLEARRSYFETLSDYYEALGDWAQSRLDLDAAIGAPPVSQPENGDK